MSPDSRDVGARIRLARQALKLSQAELARKLEISLSMLSKSEVGTTTPGLDTLERLARLANVDRSWIVSGTGRGITTVVAERGPVWETRRRALPKDWCERMARHIAAQRVTIEAGYLAYNLPMAEALAPALRAFDEDVKEAAP